MRVIDSKDLDSKYFNGDYVFHGSGGLFEFLSPRQPWTFDKNKKKMVKDGPPAVCATDDWQIAVFMAVLSKENVLKTIKNRRYFIGYRIKNDKILFEATPEVLKEVKKKNVFGYVYIFDKKEFTFYKEREWRAYKSVKPVVIVKVGCKDLPSNIKLVNFPLQN